MNPDHWTSRASLPMAGHSNRTSPEWELSVTEIACIREENRNSVSALPWVSLSTCGASHWTRLTALLPYCPTA